MNSFGAFLLGTQISAGLIIGLGPQNLYVIHRGMRSGPKWQTPTICMCCDIILTAVGIFAVGSALLALGLTHRMAEVFAGVILCVYGLKMAWSARRLSAAPTTAPATSLSHPIAGAFAVSLLNPAVYIDTMAILGSVGATMPSDARLMYLLGAWLAAALWFYGITYCAAYLARFANTPRQRKIVDLVLAAICICISISFFFP